MSEIDPGASNFTLKQLRYFVVVAGCDTVTKAAEILNISQPSISAALAHLEAEFNSQLFFRKSARGLTLTPAGRQLYEEARRLLAHVSAFQEIADGISSGEYGKLEMGCILTIAPMLMAPLASALNESTPGLKVRCHELDVSALQAGLRDGRLEVAITYNLDLDDDIEFHPFTALPPYVIVPKWHPLVGSKRVSLADLQGEPLIILDLPYTHDYIQMIFHNLDISPNIAHRSMSSGTIRSMVANGLGYAILNARPRHRRSQDNKEYAELDLNDDIKPLELGFAFMKSRQLTRSAQAMTREVIRQCESVLGTKVIATELPTDI